MGQKDGLYRKYTVIRTDGRVDPGAEYIVLRVDEGAKNRHAAIAGARAYASAIEDALPDLAADIRSMTMWTQYKRKGLSEMRPYCEGDDMTGVSVSEADAANGSPMPGDMIARNPKNHEDQWLVARQYFEDNLEPA